MVTKQKSREKPVKVPDVVVAEKGHQVAITGLGDRSFLITDDCPVNLYERFDPIDVERSVSVRTSLEQGWLKAYKGEKLTPRPKAVIEIPKVMARKPNTSVPVAIVKEQRPNTPLSVTYQTEIPDAIEQHIREVSATNKEADLEEKKRILARQQKDLRRDHERRERRKPIPKIERVVIDGAQKPAGYEYKAPKTYKER